MIAASHYSRGLLDNKKDLAAPSISYTRLSVQNSQGDEKYDDCTSSTDEGGDDDDEKRSIVTEKLDPLRQDLALSTFDHRESVFNASIEGLRGVAVTLTCLSHILPLGYSNPLFLGGTGVNIFFVLSGFLMTRILLRHQEASKGWKRYRHLPGFYLDRFMRLTPALFFMVASISMLRISRGDNKSYTLRCASLALTYTTNINSIRRTEDNGYFGNTWSLAVEEQFYVIWAILLPLLSRLRSPVKSILLFTIIIVSWAMRYYAITFDSDFFGGWYIGGLTNFYRMFFGAILHLTPTPMWLKSQRSAYAGLILLVCNIAIASVFKVTQKNGELYMGPISLLSTMLMIAGTEGEMNGLYIFEGRIVRFLGKCSYAWYLWQYPLLLYDEKRQHIHGWGDTCMALCAAMFSTYMIEDPIRKRYQAWKKSHKRREMVTQWPL